MPEVNPTPSKRLVFRLTSLGDVILASSILRDGVRTDWVCSREYAGLLEGHPAVGRVIPFDRGAGLAAWLKLCWGLARQGGYAEVVDLHASLRTRLARWVWLAARPAARWRTLSKERVRRWLFALLKSALPISWRPTLYLTRVQAFAHGPSGGSVARGTDLSHLVTTRAAAPTPYFAVMPSSRWESKQWPAPIFAEALQRLSLDLGGRARFVILGLPSDQGSAALLRECERRGMGVESNIGQRTFAELAQCLAGARGYIGVDTGLAHLAEAVGTDAFVVFGPATPEYGFGPWRAGSRAAGKALWCRPCGKDGRACFRATRRHACVKELSAQEVLPVLGNWARNQLAERT